MHFAFDENQLEFRSQLRALTDKSCTPADIREAWASERGWSPSRWAALAEMGVLGLTVPENYDGLGLGLVDLVLLLEEAGRSGLPEPLLETTALAVPVLRDAGGAGAEQRRARWLGAIAAGDRPRRHRDRPRGRPRCRPFPAPAEPTFFFSNAVVSSMPSKLRRPGRRRGDLSTVPGDRPRWRGSRPRRLCWLRAAMLWVSSLPSLTGRRWAPGRCCWGWPTG